MYHIKCTTYNTMYYKVHNVITNTMDICCRWYLYCTAIDRIGIVQVIIYYIIYI